MGFFGKTDPIAKLTAAAEKNPKDVKVALELAGLLKAKGSQSAAIEQYMRAVNLFVEQGFAQKAVAVAKQVIGFAPDTIEPHEFLAQHYEKNNLKEELRLELRSVVRIYNETGRVDEAREARRKIESLGPGR
jgi:tetratricopeptide (TPR) repeat protein